MAWKSDLTGEIITNEIKMVTLTVWDSTAGEEVERCFKNLNETKNWIKLPEPRPNLGGEIKLSSHWHVEIIDETKKITIEWYTQTFVFSGLAEASAWYKVHKGS